MRETRPLLICMVASEALPYAKSGGLADVAGSLPKAIAGTGCRVLLFHPLYRTVRKRFPRLDLKVDGLDLDVGGETARIRIFEHRPFPGVTSFLVEHDPSFDRDGLYGDEGGDYQDNGRRFSVFCRAVSAALSRMGIRPDVIHCHDWQAALIPLHLRHRREMAPFLAETATLMTIHNLAYQGIFDRGILDAAGVPESLFHMNGVEFYGKINFLKGGILSADAVSTVSSRYSREIQTEEFGAGLENVLKGRSEDLHGILNGVDYDIWNPSSDPHLAANYSAENLAGKELCKADLLRSFGLSPDPSAPLMATISRLIDQKGFDIIAPVLPSLLEAGYRYILLGAGGRAYQDLFGEIARRYPERMAVKIAYDEPLAHRIEAGADFFLMPSRYEPCGLNQIYSLRYGTIPIVRATGGLDDTITNYQPATGEGNGLKFVEYSPEALFLKAHEGFLLYRKPRHMGRVIRNAMAEDFSWNRSARRYLELYRRLVARRKRR
jgi:starch synthase